MTMTSIAVHEWPDHSKSLGSGPDLVLHVSSRYTSHLTRVCTGRLGLTLSNSGWPYAYFLHSNL